MQALFRATASKHPDKGLIAHSDQGSPYCTHDYQDLLQQSGMIASMSRKGGCYDNAPMESFWGILKTELIHHRRFKTWQQAIHEITEYIEIFYNRQRKQERLGLFIASTIFAAILCKSTRCLNQWTPFLTAYLTTWPT